MKLDKKFHGDLRKVKDDSKVPDDQYVVFLAKDDAFAAVLPMYAQKCRDLCCDPEQIKAVDGLMTRVDEWRKANPNLCKKPDAHGEKLLG